MITSIFNKKVWATREEGFEFLKANLPPANCKEWTFILWSPFPLPLFKFFFSRVGNLVFYMISCLHMFNFWAFLPTLNSSSTSPSFRTLALYSSGPTQTSYVLPLLIISTFLLQNCPWYCHQCTQYLQIKILLFNLYFKFSITVSVFGCLWNSFCFNFLTSEAAQWFLPASLLHCHFLFCSIFKCFAHRLEPSLGCCFRQGLVHPPLRSNSFLTHMLNKS